MSGNCTRMAAPSECPCGLLPGPNGTCSQEQFPGLEPLQEACGVGGTCAVRAVFPKVMCVCQCGWTGETCEIEVRPYVANQILSIVLPLLFMAFSIYKVGKMDKCLWERKSDSSSTGTTPLPLLIFRFVVFTVCSAMLAYRFTEIGPFGLVAFTICNFILMLLYFGLGIFLSLKRMIKGPSARTGSSLSYLERLHWIIIQVELPASIFIFVIVWLLLFPGAVIIGRTELLLHPFSVFSHGLNVLFLAYDYMQTGYEFKKENSYFFVIWCAIYMLWHSSVMIFRESVLDVPHCSIYPMLSHASPFMVLMELTCLAFFYFIFVSCASLLNRKKKQKESVHHASEKNVE